MIDAGTGDDDNDDDWFVDHIFSSPFFLTTPKHVAAAVSGGSDSMALLSYLCLWGERQGVTVSAMTVDHGLRDGSAEEAAQVAVFCKTRGIAHAVLRWTGGQGKGNLQARAREARYELMADHAKAEGIDVIALGHTQDDLAENFLIRLRRQSGVDGLAAMEDRFERYGMTWVRPLLQRSRAKARAHLRRQGIAWVEDPSNDDLGFERVRARKLLAGLQDFGITTKGLAESSHNIWTAKSALDHYTLKEAVAHVETSGGDLLLPRLEPMPVEIERRLKVAALRWVGREAYAPRSRALGDMEFGLQQSGAHTLAGCYITQEDSHLRFTREWNSVKGLTSQADAIWDGRWQLDGPHEEGLATRALGEVGLQQCPDWREAGLPRMSLLATPSIWRGDALIAAPLAGVSNGWSATLRQPFLQFLADGLQHG